MVDVDQVLDFLFPAALQHPLSNGRLYGYALYGPLDDDSQLRAGHKGQHIVQGWELDAMCMQFELEMILEVCIPPGQPMASLNRQQQQEVLAQADSHLKTSKGLGYMPQISRDQVLALFRSVPRAEDGTVSFHDLQKLINGYREEQVAR
ncbi:unnamed protein product [Chrysoparadoxa australica]